ncbi:acyl-CoA dehydrogenase family protein [Bacillus sp. FJAT-49736]|uniref:acyl-CoA dehydrogenase family protein n=1 Tax=Bacillus sp. FJAT-49736 TaxID=2833582 RepID=UPI001BC94070|nr:acyl-CoA dehydrogenase family protein [Bacillus sp. FJAT-49736]MBS4172901.1 acyl-CoA dehydrogenase family protein [Bacillus sp. FJAT-49736]
MISFQSTEEERSFTRLAKAFAQDYIRPAAREAEQTKGVGAELIHEVYNLGFSALELPESWDGLELPLVTQVKILEELAFGDLAILQGTPGYGDASVWIRLDRNNPVFNSLKKEDPPQLAFINDTEQSFTAIESELSYIVNGVSNPIKMAGPADYIILAAADLKGMPILFLLNNNQWRRISEEYRLGLLAANFARIQLDHTRIPMQQVIATGDNAQKLLDESLARLRVLEAAKEVGLLNAALQYATKYTTERKAFGQEIAKFQGVSFTIAQMAMKTNTARNLVLYAANQLDRQEKDATLCSLVALHNTHKALRFVTDAAVQLLGGHGYVQDHLVEKWMRDAQAQVISSELETDLLLQSGELLLKEETE